MRRSGEVDEGVTVTEPSTPERPVDAGQLGVLWVAPEERFTPLADGLTVGRGSSADVVLEGNGISRLHARFRRDGPLWLIEDLGSKNGTRVNRRPLSLAPVEEQTVVRVGDWVGVVCRLPKTASPSVALFEEAAPGWVAGVPTQAKLGPIGAMAAHDLSVVLVGETGTGKEVLARALHALSGRRGRFVALNCAAIPENMAESELFGHRKGAFTGAVQQREGFVAAADGGTLFLDEIGDLPASIQAKLLRVLEERAVTPIGSTHPRGVDFKLIAATQEPLADLVEEGTFRRDLCARVMAAELTIPPLRERREDVPRLFRFAAKELPAGSKATNAAFIEALCAYAWPSNVRELVQLVRLISLSEKDQLTAEDLPERFAIAAERPEVDPAQDAELSRPPPGRREAWMLRHAAELGRLKAALQETDNVSRAAREAGIPRYRALRLLAAESALARERGSC